MSDTIFVNGLVIHAYHGVMPHEAKVGQPFLLDLVLDIDLSEASRSDTVKSTVSYEKLVATVTEVFRARRYRLIEAAAGAVAEAVLATYAQAREIQVTVRKPHAPIAATFQDVGVIIKRSRRKRNRKSQPSVSYGTPVVFGLAPDPVGSKLVTSLALPGGNGRSHLIPLGQYRWQAGTKESAKRVGSCRAGTPPPRIVIGI